MGLESFPNLQAKEIKINREFDIEKTLEKPESIFTEIDAPQEVKEAGLTTYERIILSNESLLGSGNAGIVFKESEKTCLKCVWESLSVEMKFKRFQLLPQKAQKLRQISEYFSEINEKRRKLSTSGFQFESDNAPLKEAGLQVAAKKILERKDMGRMVPGLKGVLEFETEDEGEVENLPYYIQEKVLLISMERVSGVNIEDLILNYPENSEILEKIDMPGFEQKLKAALQELHAAGLCHKDLSIRNVMIDFESGEPRLIDFGKAKATDDSADFEEENRLADNVLGHLKRFKANPAEKRKDLEAGYKKFEEKF
jgi:serine/threonine protein kinase